MSKSVPKCQISGTCEMSGLNKNPTKSRVFNKISMLVKIDI